MSAAGLTLAQRLMPLSSICTSTTSPIKIPSGKLPVRPVVISRLPAESSASRGISSIRVSLPGEGEVTGDIARVAGIGGGRPDVAVGGIEGDHPGGCQAEFANIADQAGTGDDRVVEGDARKAPLVDRKGGEVGRVPGDDRGVYEGEVGVFLPDIQHLPQPLVLLFEGLVPGQLVLEGIDLLLQPDVLLVVFPGV